jgi:hypothetical protein
MATTDSTPKVFSWADLQGKGKQGGFMQRDEITQEDHQLLMLQACKRLQTGLQYILVGMCALSWD